MGALAANQQVNRRNASRDILATNFKATAALFIGSLLVWDGAQEGVKKATGTTLFAGIALSQAEAAGDYVEVLQDGLVETTINASITWGSVEALVYASTSGSSDNLEDATTTATSNLPIGRIAQVLATGSQGTNRVVIHLQAGSFVSR